MPSAGKAPVTPPAGKAPAGEVSKRQQKRLDDAALLEHDGAARKERVIGRLLKLLFVGFLLKLRPQKKITGPRWKAEDIKSAAMAFMGLALVVYMKLEGEAMSFHVEMTRPEAAAMLGIKVDASVNEANKAYRSLSKDVHPDKNPDCVDCPEKFRKIAAAFEVMKGGKSTDVIYLTAASFRPTTAQHPRWMIQVVRHEQEENEALERVAKVLVADGVKVGRVAPDDRSVVEKQINMRVFPPATVLYSARFGFGEVSPVFEEARERAEESGSHDLAGHVRSSVLGIFRKQLPQVP